MGTLRLDRLLDFLTSIELLVGLLWAGLAALTVALLILMQTRWGQSRPLRKCLVLSLLAHLLLAGYATTVQIVGSPPLAAEPVVHVSLVEGPSPRVTEAGKPGPEEEPWEQLPHDDAPQPDPIDPQRKQPDQPPEPKRQNRTEPADLPGDPSLDHLPPVELQQPEPKVRPVDGPTGRASPGSKSAEQIEAPAAQRREAPRVTVPSAAAPSRRAVVAVTPSPPVRTPTAEIPVALIQQQVPLPRLASPTTTPEPASSLAGVADRLSPVGHAASETLMPSDAEDGASGRPQRATDRKGPGERPVPDIYKLRVAPDRTRRAQQQGATPETEVAVKAALKWLAAIQKPDGRWDAGEHGAGRELVVAGRDRQGAGIQADTGMTGLALLSFLASGHTHREGPYRETVRLGLQYLLRIQARDGNLAGRATPYATMYCHSMAAFALSEAYGMTGDERLEQPIRRAIDYTVAAQDPTGGGYRYSPGDPGDTSQCGWQLMALRSAELAGIPIPQKTRNGLIRYLHSVSAGKHGGLASYRPKEQITRPMTAEALVCWQFLGLPREHPSGNEAGDYLLGELPGEGKTNLYYWYYATLGMYQLQGTHWQRWNDALRSTLVASQRKTGPLAGTWDPDSVWGCYGGRIYSTTMAALCLEVYYRFLPLYADAAPAEFSPGVHARKESPRGRGG